MGVFGLGKSGIATARALIAGNADVAAWDDDPIRRNEAIQREIPIKDLYSIDWSQMRALVLSPGIPLHHPEPHKIVCLARQNGIEILGDIELLAREKLSSRIVAITGTNGKSTTTALTTGAVKACGREVVTGGNIGEAVLDLPVLTEDGIYVLELSSYQIDLITSLSADLAVLLNLAPDHLERHDGMSGYVAAKKRLFDMQNSSQTAIVGVDDFDSFSIFKDLHSNGRKVIPISGSSSLDGGVYVQEGLLTDSRNGKHQTIASLNTSKIPGEHNLQNAAAAFVIATELGCETQEVIDALLDFPGLPHRLDSVATINGINFVNDSKATNIDAAAKALALYEDIYWIVGGRPKELSIDALENFFPRIRHAFLIGEATEVFSAVLDKTIPLTRSYTINQAVQDAYLTAKRDGHAGSVVLLSPACSSFDQFSNFEDRGNAFSQAVLMLEGSA